MSKKLHSKLLSVILCIAICCATLCGSIIAVNAVAADYNGTYTITVGDEKNAVPFAATEVKAQVKFDLPAGFVGGQFTANAQSTYTIGDTATIVAATDEYNNVLTADEISEKTKVADGEDIPAFNIVTKADGSNKSIRFVLDGLYTSITIEYTLLFTEGNYVQESVGKQYPVSITLDEDDLVQFATYDLQDVTFTASTESDTFFHAHCAWFDATALSDVNGGSGGLKNVELTSDSKYVPINTKDGKHTIASGTCTVCGSVDSSNSYKKSVQVIPDITEFDGKTTLKATTGWCSISGVTVRYNDNGGLDVDVHVYSQYRSGTVDLLICDTEGNELYRLPCVENGTSYYADNGFPTAEKMFTITGLSARDIDTELLLTLAEYGDGTNLWLSRTMPFCLAVYCENVVTGVSTVWASGATEAQIEADKDVAAALYYYGASIQENVFDKNTSNGNTSNPTFDYIQKTSDTWDGSQVEPTATDANGNILINTAEELAWIALRGDAETAGKSYKVADGIGAFYMTPNGADSYDNSSFEKLKETLTASTDLKGNTLNKWVCKSYVSSISGWASFQGSFDGNGITIYGLSGLSTDTGSNGLFPYIKGDVTFKNIIITDSYISSNNNVGAIFGSTFNNTNCLNSISIENCIVVGNYLDQTKAGTGNGWCNIAGLGGSIGVVTGSVSVNNCAIVDNNMVNASSEKMKTRAFFGNFLNYDTSVVTVSIKNSFTDLNTYANGYYPNNNANYTNIYTTCTDTADFYTGHDVTVLASTDAMKGAAALNTMNLDDTVWVANNNYPELLLSHTLKTISVDNETHKTICLHKINGYACQFDGIVNNHILIKNSEGTAKTCECGYSEEIIGNAITPNNKIKVAWDGTKPETLAASGITGSGTDKDPYIIKTPAQLWYVAQLMNNDSAGKYFKVADNIAVFDMCGSKYTWSLKSSSSYFQGHFDGNGVEIINLVATGWNIGLFPYVKGNVNFSNLKVTGANLTCSGTNYAQAGVIFGVSAATSITFDNCHISDCVLSATGTNPTMGVLGSASSGAAITIKDCFLASETTVNPIGYVNTSGHSVNNVILINGSFNSNYTTQNNVYTASTAVTGDGAVAAMNLGSNWFDTNGYPELHVFHDMIDIYVDEDTHKSVCQVYIDGTQQCSTCGIVEEHALIENAEGTANECSCGYYEEINGNTITPNNKIKVAWDGSMPATLEASGITGGGTSGDPYIIKTPAQLYYVVQKAVDASAGKYYEIDKDIAVFDMAGKNWNSSNSNFQGHLNGNGVEIINLKTSGWDTGLIPRAYGATIENIKVTGATIEGNAGGAYAGVLVGNVTGGTVTLNGCVVVDSTVTADDYVGALIGVVGNNHSAVVSNCFVSNNTVTTRNSNYASNRMIGAGGWGTGKITVDSTIVIGNDRQAFSSYTKLYDSSSAKTGSGAVDDMGLDSSVWFDTDGYPELHVFHDMATVTIDANTHQYVCQVYVDGVQCTICQSATIHNMVDAEDGKSASCDCGYSYEIKGIHAMDLPTSIINRITSNSVYTEKFATNALFKAGYNADVLGTETSKNTFDLYTTSLNLKVNPHIGFMFAFHGDYKTNRSNITVTFTVDGTDYTTEAVETSGALGINWVNNKGAGRYHLYRFKELPISKLCQDIKVTVNYGGNTYDFGTYSAAGYAINAMNAGEDYQEHVNAAMSLVYYSEMLAARAGA